MTATRLSGVLSNALAAAGLATPSRSLGKKHGAPYILLLYAPSTPKCESPYRQKFAMMLLYHKDGPSTGCARTMNGANS